MEVLCKVVQVVILIYHYHYLQLSEEEEVVEIILTPDIPAVQEAVEVLDPVLRLLDKAPQGKVLPEDQEDHPSHKPVEEVELEEQEVPLTPLTAQTGVQVKHLIFQECYYTMQAVVAVSEVMGE